MAKVELEDVLSQNEIKEYNEEWESFTDKYKLETPYNVHSALPIIGKVFQFRDKPVFRAHIFKRKLKKAFDPYFISRNGYLYPYFHTVHYFFPIEQVTHVALSRLIPNYNRYVITDILDNKKAQKMKGQISFTDTRASIGLIFNVTKGKNRYAGKASATFYDEKTGQELQNWYLRGIAVLRNYVEVLQRLKQGDPNAISDLIRKIEVRATKQRKLINPRNFPSNKALIEKLRSGEIPEEELHNFFSYWDSV